jgi:hypothetical protein
MNKPVRPVLLILATILLLSSSAVLFAAETSLERPVFKSGKATLTFADAPLKTMTETPFAIKITGDTGIVISDAKLSTALDMPDMPMPPNHPAATWKDGAYRGTAIFTMAGAWEMTVNIQRPGYDQEHVLFKIDQVMMK